MTREEAKHIVDVAFSVPQAVRRDGEDRTYHEDEIREAKNMAIQALSQEPTDAISRDELLKAIDTWDKFGYTETGCFVREPKGDYVPYIHYDDVIKSIKGMPSVTQKSGKWIPVSERLPEDGKWAIFTDGKNISVERFKLDAISHFFPNGRWFELEDAIAWMPLPKPYEPQERSE